MRSPLRNKSINLEFVKKVNQELGLPYCAGAVLSARGVNSIQDAVSFFSDDKELKDPFLMASMPEAVDSVVAAIKNNKKIFFLSKENRYN